MHRPSRLKYHSVWEIDEVLIRLGDVNPYNWEVLHSYASEQGLECEWCCQIANNYLFELVERGLE